MSGELASGATHPFGKCLNLAQMWGVEGEDSIRLPQLGLLDDNCLSLLIPRLGHF